VPNTNLSQNPIQTLLSHESVETAVMNAVTNAIQSLEPQLQKYASQVAHQAVDRGQELAERTYRRVQRQPMMLVGFAALALAGIAISLVLKSQDSTPKITH
jgi:type VI protein secretion system component VasF